MVYVCSDGIYKREDRRSFKHIYIYTTSPTTLWWQRWRRKKMNWSRATCTEDLTQRFHELIYKERRRLWVSLCLSRFGSSWSQSQQYCRTRSHVIQYTHHQVMRASIGTIGRNGVRDGGACLDKRVMVLYCVSLLYQRKVKAITGFSLLYEWVWFGWYRGTVIVCDGRQVLFHE